MDDEKSLLAYAAEVIDRDSCPRTALWLDEMALLEEENPEIPTKRLVYSLVGFLNSLELRIVNLEKKNGIKSDSSVE